MGRRHTATCTGTGGGAELSGAKQAGIWGLPSPLLSPPFPNQHVPSAAPFPFLFLAALPGEIRLLQRAGARHAQPGRVQRGAEVRAFNSTLQLRLQGCCQHSEGLFVQPEGSFCSWRLSASRSDAKAQPALFGEAGPCPAPAAGCRLLAPSSRCFICLLWPRCSPRNKIRGEAEIGDGWEMSGG